MSNKKAKTFNLTPNTYRLYEENRIKMGLVEHRQQSTWAEMVLNPALLCIENDGYDVYRQKLTDDPKRVIPALALLQSRLERGEYLAQQDEEWWLFEESGEGIASGKTLNDLLANLIDYQEK